MEEGNEPVEGDMQDLPEKCRDGASPDFQTDLNQFSEIEQGQEENEEDADFGSVQEPEQSSRRKSRHEHSSRHRSHKRRSRRHSRRRHEEGGEEEMEQEDEESEFPDNAGTEMIRLAEENDMEDGEILEDGEIATDEEEDGNAKYSVPENDAASAGESDDHGNGSEGDENKTKERSKRDRRKRVKKEKRHKEGKQKKKSRRHATYVDHDRIEDESGGRWSGYPSGPCEEDEIYDTHYQGSSHYSRKRHSTRSPYCYAGSSPPGLYDSPSEESEDEVPSVQQSMTSLVSDEYIDANVAASEKEPVKVKGSVKSREKRRNRLGKRKGDSMRHLDQQPKKKPLLEIPMAERPICKFFKEGKCAKGSSCPFNHDFRPKRLEVCKFYTTQNGCQKGENCIYMHGDYPCKYYHTGAPCFSGDNCRFSHDPLTEETRRIVEEMNYHKDLEMDLPERPVKKPSLLGSPPRHIKEAAERAKEVKKIPSLFDIEVFPPGKEPPIPSGFYSERSPRGEKSPPPERKLGISHTAFNSDSNQCPGGMNSPPHQGQMPMPSQGFSPSINQGPCNSLGSHQPGPSLLGSPGQGTAMRLPMHNNTQQGPLMMGGPNGPSAGRPMMGQQRPMFGMQQGVNHAMQQGINSGMQQGMNPGMQQGMNPGMQQGMNPGMQQRMPNPGMQGMNPGMQQGLRPGMQQGMMQAMNPNLQQGINQGMKPGMQQGGMLNMSQNMNLSMQGMNPPMSTSMQQGMNPGMQHGINTSGQQGINPGVQQGMNPGMQQGMNPGMQQGMNPGMQQGMNPNMPQGINSNMQQGMNLQPGTGINPSLQQGMNTKMQQGIKPGMHQGMGPGILNPRMPGGPRLAFNMAGGQQTVSSMPPVLNMISALLRGASSNGPFNQNCPQQPVQQTGVGVAQDTDMRRPAGGVDVRQAEPSSHSSNQDDAGTEESVGGDHEDESFNSSQDSDVLPESSSHSQEDVSDEQAPSQSNVEVAAESQLSDDKEEEDEGKPASPSQNSTEGSLSSEEDQPAAKSSGDKENESAILMHLPPMQRQLFMRIRQQQLHQHQQLDAEEALEDFQRTNKNAPAANEEKHVAKMDDDDNWYSSDEEDLSQPKSKLTDILKTINQTATSSIVTTASQSSSEPDSSTGTSGFSTASTFNVMQMIQSIRNQAQSDKSASLSADSSVAAISASLPSTTIASGTPPQRDPRQRQADPRLKRSSGPEGQLSTPCGQLPVLPPLHVYPSVTNAVPASPMVYQISVLILPGTKTYSSLPSTVDPSDPQQKSDPRIQRFLKLQEEKAVETKKPQDPRLRRSNSLAEGSNSPTSRPQDPRAKRKDPRVQGMLQDPRSQPMGPQDPRMQNPSSHDPRLQSVSRQEPWMQNNVGGNMMQHQMGTGGMMQQQNIMGPGPDFQNGMMPGPRMMQNDPRNNAICMPGGPTNMQQGTMGIQQGPMGMQQGPMGMQQVPMGMQQGPMGMQQGPLGMQQGPMGMQQGQIGMQQGPVRIQQGPVGMQQRPMGMQQGLINMQQGPVSMQGPMGFSQDRQGPLGMQQDLRQGPLAMQHDPRQSPGAMPMPQGMGMQQDSAAMLQDPRNNQANTTDSRAGDPRLKRGPQGDPRQLRPPLLPAPGSGLDPRMTRLGVGGPRQGSNSSPHRDDPGSSPSHHREEGAQPHRRNSNLHLRMIPSPPRHSTPEDCEISKPVVAPKNDSTTLPESGLQHSLNSGLTDLVPKSELEGNVSDEGSNSEDSSGSKSKKAFDHRNDPRFKRKPASEKCVNSERTRKFIGQRKSSMEYSSPLGGGDDGEVNTEPGYNSYNRPPQGPGRPTLRDRTSVSVVASDLSHVESPQQHPPPDNVVSPESMPPEPEPLELKDLFRTIDPTASPFC